MTFLNPAMLFGLLAVSLPIAIHLLSKPRLKRIPWAATRFLLASVQKNRRRVQAEDIILLILRALLVALLALLFARPAWLTDAGPQLGGLAAPAVILLDNSMSMGQSDGTQTRFDKAKDMAGDLLTHLEPGSSSALYLVSDHVKAVIPKPTQDMATLRRSIDQAPLTDGGTDLYLGIKQAVDLLKGLSGTHKEIFVLTDSQAAGWKQLGKIKDLEDLNKKDITFHILIVGDHGEDNLAVSGLQLAGTTAAVNQPLRCAITVSNWGRTAAQNVPVKLAADDSPPQDEGMIDSIDPGASKIITLVARFRDPGYHSLTASIPGDRLPADNQRSTALLVLDQINALVVEGTTNPDFAARDGFFLSHALVPVSPDQAAQYYVKAVTVAPDELESSTIGQNQIIFLSNVAQLSPRGAQNLRDYVTHGGALVVFPGPGTDLNFYNNDLNFSALLPATLGHSEGPPEGQKFLGWQSKNYEHPLVTLWNKPESGNLGGVRVLKYFPLTPKTPTDASAPTPQVVVKYANGEPAVVEQSVGKGRVILFSSTATTAWSSLPIHPSFVPLLIRIISYVTSLPGGGLNLAPGQPFAGPVDTEYAGKELSVVRPGEKKHRIVGTIEAGEQSAFLRYADTDLAGPYQLFIGDDAKPAAVFAVQSDPEESNLAQEAKPDIDPLLNPTATLDAATGTIPDATASGTHRKVPGQELWFPLAITALLLALIETALAHRFSQSK
jgi:von Willebrand factor type A domain/Aerotolerance regulator N-terminal